MIETAGKASEDGEESKKAAKLEDLIGALTKDKESLLAQVKDLESKETASTDKVKKLKVLLTKQKKVTEIFKINLQKLIGPYF